MKKLLLILTSVFCSVVFLLGVSGCGKTKESTEQINVTKASSIHIITHGMEYLHGAMTLDMTPGSGVDMSSLRDSRNGDVVYIVRDFIGADQEFISTAKLLGLKEGKAYIRTGSPKYVYNYICDVDLKLSDYELCKQFGVE
jgi:hypothetical protein